MFALLLKLYFLVIFPFNIIDVFIDTHCERVFDSVKIFVIVRETAIFNSHMLFLLCHLYGRTHYIQTFHGIGVRSRATPDG